GRARGGPDVSTLSLSDLAERRPALVAEFDRRLGDYEKAVRSGAAPRLEDVLEGVTVPDYRVLLRHALEMHLELRQSLGQPVALEDYLVRFGDHDLVNSAFAAVRTAPHAHGVKPQRLPHVPGYEVVEELGQGGMGVVYKAMHQRLRRLEALKMIQAG